MNTGLKWLLEKSDGVEQEIRAEPDRLLGKHHRPARDQGLETWLGARNFVAKGESGQIEVQKPRSSSRW